MVVTQTAEGEFAREIRERRISELPAGDLLVRVAYSSLNFKDALAAVGRRGVAKAYPLTPGIDAAGQVVQSGVEGFSPGDEVVVTGHELGIGISGGFAEYIKIPADWAISLPSGLTPREAMILGTAGFTAALALDTLQQQGLSPDRGEVLVTGATGGVGSLTVALLAANGYAVAAGTGKPQYRDLLLSLGAREILPRDLLDDASGKALLRERWSGVVDTVGGSILSTAIRSTCYGGSVAACGNAKSPELPLTVFPFILRGVRLLGIESARCPIPLRKQLWGKLAGPWKLSRLDSLARECSLRELSRVIDEMLLGKLTGRVIVNLHQP
jgi:putative YhdH/YhfP family quinone oxidoreductase